MMRRCSSLALAVLLGCAPHEPPRRVVTSPPVTSADVAEPLRAPSELAGIADREARSIALFVEASRVITSPRCMNCHPADRMPTQGDDRHAHVPPMWAGVEGHGPAGLGCNTCHQAANVRTLNAPIASVPGNPEWGLAPATMAWQGLGLSELCVRIKDPQHNGNRSLAQIHEHMAKDPLVGWAWHPGDGRRPAPGTQDRFGELVLAWIESGAACPAP